MSKVKTFPQFAPMVRTFRMAKVNEKFSRAVPVETCEPKLNRYTCGSCGYEIVTVERVVGVTPMMLNCRNTEPCKGRMMSAWYRDVTGVPLFEWRMPTNEEYRRMPPEVREHVDQGGLMIYPIEAQP